MGKKKNKIPKITEEEYFAYVTGLKTGVPNAEKSAQKSDGGKDNKVK